MQHGEEGVGNLAQGARRFGREGLEEARRLGRGRRERRLPGRSHS